MYVGAIVNCEVIFSGAAIKIIIQRSGNSRMSLVFTYLPKSQVECKNKEK